MRPFSMNRAAQIFGRDRQAIYAWIRRGCPCIPPEGPGKPARLDFMAVFKWRLNRMAETGYSEEARVREEGEARARVKALTSNERNRES